MRQRCSFLAQGQYVPWATQDINGLTTHLPDTHEGAGKWIKVFEDEALGTLIVVGYVKALLAKILGGAKWLRSSQQAA